MISIASTLIHGRVSPALRIATDEFDLQSKKVFSLCREFGEESSK